MKKIRLYLDTSVIGGYYDKEFMDATRMLFDDFRSGRYIPLISTLTLSELQKAPDKVKELIIGKNKLLFEMIEDNIEAELLASKYLEAKILSHKWSDDCLHVALAVVSNADILLSWNFKHIVQFEKIHAFNEVNVLNGYRILEIYNPLEVIYHDE